MGAYSRSFMFRPQEESPGPTEDAGPVQPLDTLFGDLQEMEPSWAEGSPYFHTRARCSRYQAIEVRNRRQQKSEPRGMTLCEICRQISVLGRKG